MSQSLTGGTISTTAPQLTISDTTNRITTAGYAYDAAGNLTNDTLHSYAYDAENRIKSKDGSSSVDVYDAAGLRVCRLSTNGTACAGSTVYVYSGTKVIAEYASGVAATSPSKEYVYSGTSLLATVVSGSTTYAYPDHLGTRVEANSSGAVIHTFGHLPFGEVAYESGTASNWKFTSYERDSETGLDYALTRLYSSRLARFLQPDRLAGSVTDPQSLNQFTYVINDPTNLMDPDGQRPTPGEQDLLLPMGQQDCLLDGIPTDCNLVRGALQMGAAGLGNPDVQSRKFGDTTVLFVAYLTQEGMTYDFAGQFRDDSLNLLSDAALAEILGLQPDASEGIGTDAADHFSQCVNTLINDVNQVFGTHLTNANLTSGPAGSTHFEFGGGLSIYLRAENFPAAQFNAIVPGRYPLSPLTAFTGIGATLHIPAGPSGLDPFAFFDKTNIGGHTSVTFTAHTDSAFAYHPIGLPAHYFIDVNKGGARRGPCP